MSVVFFDGFETGDISAWGGNSSAVTVVTNTFGMGGGFSGKFVSSGGAGSYLYSFGSSESGWLGLYTRFHLYIASIDSSLTFSTGITIFSHNNSSGSFVAGALILSSDGSGNPYLNLAGPSQSSQIGSAYELALDTVYTIEMCTFINASGGVDEVRVNGVIVATGSGLNTGSSGVVAVPQAYPLSGSPNATVYMDDFLCSTSGYPGPGACVAIKYTSATPTYNTWTKTGGTTMDQIWNNQPYSGSIYVSDSTATNAQTAVLSTTSMDGGTTLLPSSELINALKIGSYGETSSTSGDAADSLRLRVNSTNTDTALSVYTTSPTFQQIYLSSIPTLSGLTSGEGGVVMGSPSGGSTVLFLTSGTSWTPPTGVTSVQAECIGGGGNGSVGDTTSRGGGGGGGGGYSKQASISVTPGTPVTYQIGIAGGTATGTGSTWFNGSSLATSSCGAEGGTSGTTTAAGAGGATTSAVGSTKNAGGAGGVPTATSRGGGGGGGAAGPNGAGASSTAPSSTSGTAGGTGDSTHGGTGGAGATGTGTAGGAGGNGAEWTATAGGTAGSGGGGGGGFETGTSPGLNGGAGGSYGGGGGAAGRSTGTGGAGKAGLIVLTYTNPAITHTVYEVWVMIDFATPSTFQFIQGIEQGSGSSGVASLSQAYPSNVLSGDLLVVAVYWGNSAVTSVTISDTLSTTWNQSNGPTLDTGSDYHATIYWGIAPSAGADTVTVNFSGAGGNFPSIFIHEYYIPSGATVSVDGTPVNGTGSSGTPNSGNITTTVSGDLLLGYISQWDSSSAFFAPTGWSTRLYSSLTAGDNITQDTITGSAGTYAATVTGQIGSDPWIAQAVAFKVSSSNVSAIGADSWIGSESVVVLISTSFSRSDGSILAEIITAKAVGKSSPSDLFINAEDISNKAALAFSGSDLEITAETSVTNGHSVNQGSDTDKISESNSESIASIFTSSDTDKLAESNTSSVKPVLVSGTDSSIISEANSHSTSTTFSGSDSEKLSESILESPASHLVGNDSEVISEANNHSVITHEFIGTDTSKISESISDSVLPALVSASDAAKLAETLSSSGGNLVSSVDNSILAEISSPSFTWNFVGNESLSLSELESVIGSVDETLSDDVGVSEFTPIGEQITGADSAKLSESASGKATGLASALDSSKISESFSGFASLSESSSDAIGVSEITPGGNINESGSDIGILSEISHGIGAGVASASDNNTFSEAFSASIKGISHGIDIDVFIESNALSPSPVSITAHDSVNAIETASPYAGMAFQASDEIKAVETAVSWGGYITSIISEAVSYVEQAIAYFFPPSTTVYKSSLVGTFTYNYTMSTSLVVITPVVKYNFTEFSYTYNMELVQVIILS